MFISNIELGDGIDKGGFFLPLDSTRSNVLLLFQIHNSEKVRTEK